MNILAFSFTAEKMLRSFRLPHLHSKDLCNSWRLCSLFIKRKIYLDVVVSGWCADTNSSSSCSEYLKIRLNFPRSLQANARILPRLGYDHFPPNSSQLFIINTRRLVVSTLKTSLNNHVRRRRNIIETLFKKLYCYFFTTQRKLNSEIKSHHFYSYIHIWIVIKFRQNLFKQEVKYYVLRFIS
jgi:hypothetical protein